MLAWLNEQDASARKFRLFTCAAARSLWELMTRDLARETVLIGERYADGECSEAERRAGAEALRKTYPARMWPDDPVSASYCAGMVAYYCAWSNPVTRRPGLHLKNHGAPSVAHWTQFTLVLAETGLWDHVANHPLAVAEAEHQCRLLRDIFGNPFHPIRFAIRWRTGAVVGVAEAIYAERGFGEMPVLGDALEEAGCSEADILAHCRQPRPHVRGCWVLDLALNKE
jgi:hypothetical protein